MFGGSQYDYPSYVAYPKPPGLEQLLQLQFNFTLNHSRTDMLLVFLGQKGGSIPIGDFRRWFLRSELHRINFTSVISYNFSYYNLHVHWKNVWITILPCPKIQNFSWGIPQIVRGRFRASGTRGANFCPSRNPVEMGVRGEMKSANWDYIMSPCSLVVLLNRFRLFHGVHGGWLSGADVRTRIRWELHKNDISSENLDSFKLSTRFRGTTRL